VIDTGIESLEGDPLEHRAAATPDRVVLVDADRNRRWTARALDQWVEELSTALPGANDPLGILMSSRPAFVRVFWAAVRTGRPLVPLNVRETPETIARKATRAGVRTIICGGETAALTRAVRAEGTPVCDVYTVDGQGTEPLEALEQSEPAALSDEPKRDTRAERDASPASVELAPETALVLFTSGTTGDPKGVRLTMSNLLASATASAFRLGLSSDDRWLCCLPMYHMGGLAPAVRSLLYGTTAVIQREFDPTDTAALLEDAGITGVSLVPTMLSRLLETGWEPASTLRFVLLGGAPASESVLEQALARKIPVCPTYGMTETASQIATATPPVLRDRPKSVGQPLVGTRVTVVDPSGEPVERGTAGELVVDGPTVTPGYLEADTDAFGPYGLHTGDLGRCDEDGYLWVLGRRSDRIISGGENVDPVEVQEVLETHPLVETAVVVGIPDPEWGERVSALVVPSESAIDDPQRTGERPALEPEMLREHCRTSLAGFKCPKTIAMTNTIPRTHSGTVDRTAVIEHLTDAKTASERRRSRGGTSQS